MHEFALEQVSTTLLLQNVNSAYTDSLSSSVLNIHFATGMTPDVVIFPDLGLIHNKAGQ